MIYGITLILLSIIAVPSLLLSRKPDAKEILEKVEPYQTWIGIIFCFWGIWGIISSILSMNLLTSSPIWWITWIAASAVQAGLGFMLGYPKIQEWMSSSSTENQEKLTKLRNRIAPLQGKLGIVGICIGIWVILAYFIFV